MQKIISMIGLLKNTEFISTVKSVINDVLIAFGFGLTFLGDFQTYANSFVESHVGQFLFIDITKVSKVDIEKVDIIVSITMRIIVGFGTLIILYYVKRNSKK